MISDLHNII